MAETAFADQITAWRALAEKALKGEPIEALRWQTPDDLILEPLYGPAEPVYAGRALAGPWQVVQRVDDDERSAAQAREDLENGASAIALTFAGAPMAFGRGLSADAVAALDEALSGIHLDLVPVHIEAGGRARAALALVMALAERRGQRLAEVHAGIDPAATLFATGRLAVCDAAPELASTLRAADRAGLNGTVFAGDGRAVAEAGGTSAQELAFALASITALARALSAEGIAPSQSLPRTALRLSANVDQVMTIAKLRAARRLFATVARHCGAPCEARLHVTTAARMLSVTDPTTNLLRLTIAAFSAGVGGADALTVLPHEGSAGPFARRMARNIQSLLLEESHVADFSDPAAGSGSIEAATDAIGEAAWSLFQQHERDGLIHAIMAGTVADAVRHAAAERHRALEQGEAAIIGVTRHPPADRKPALQRDPVAAAERVVRQPLSFDQSALVDAAISGATLFDLSGEADATTIEAPAIPPSRECEPFET